MKNTLGKTLLLLIIFTIVTSFDYASAQERCLANVTNVLRQLSSKSSNADLDDRMQWLISRPRAQIRIQESGSMYSIDRSGLPADAEIVELTSPMVLYHYTNPSSARLFINEQRMIAGKTPYINAFHAGTEMIYTNYVDATGIFFVDHIVNQNELGYIGASNVSVLLRVTLPAGIRILRLSSMQDHIPFYLIPLGPGNSFSLSIEQVL